MGEFHALCSIADIPDPGRQCFEIDERLVVLFHVGGEFYCLDDVCTHDGGPLGEGEFDERSVACPRHGARFDLRTGAALSMPATEPTAAHEVKVEQGRVFVRIGE